MINTCIPSVRPGVEVIIERWKKTTRAMLGNNKFYADKVIKKAMMCNYDNLYGIKDLLEAAVFSVLIEMEKEIDELREE